MPKISLNDSTTITISPLTVKMLIESSALEALIDWGNLSVSEYQQLKTFLVFVVYTTEYTQMPSPFKDALDGARLARNEGDLRNVCDAFFDAIGDQFEYYTLWLNAINDVRLPKNEALAPDADDKKK